MRPDIIHPDSQEGWIAEKNVLGMNIFGRSAEEL